MWLPTFVVLIVSIGAVCGHASGIQAIPKIIGSNSAEFVKKNAQSPLSTQKKPASTLKLLLPVVAASFCAAAIMYPLDLVRALQMANAAGPKQSALQLLSAFRKQHGVAGFFTQGLVPELARATWMRTLKFGLFPIIHMSLTGLPESKGTGATKAAAAILTSIPECIR